jgi:BirA family biotin operon repressor/biotin-[acetyl-CoA-carboxylase] ligase
MNFERINPIRFDEIDSTNAEAMRMLKRVKPPEGTCIVAGFQKEGRGQRANIWASRPGENLMVSFILYPRPHMAQQPFLLSKSMALAVCKTIASFTKGSVMIKWPNDILIDGKKVAGILLENQWSGANWQSTIAGIGININQTEFALEKATSLAIVNGNTLLIDIVLKELQTRITYEYDRLCNGMETSINEDYHQQLFGKDDYHHYQTAHGQQKMKVLGVKEDGRLELIHENGGIHRYDLNEVHFKY